MQSGKRRWIKMENSPRVGQLKVVLPSAHFVDILIRVVYSIWSAHLYGPLLTRIDKTSLGMSRIGVAIPWDDWPYGRNNDNTFVRALAYRIFLTSCVGINLGDTPRGLRHPRGVPSVDPSTLGQKSYTHSPSLKYCYIPICAYEPDSLKSHWRP